MAFDGNGNYIRIHNWTQDAANGLDINAGEMDAEDNSIQGAFNITVTRDGQGKMAADFVPVASGTYNLGTGGLQWLNVAAKSGSIGPPASGFAWTVNAVSGSYAAKFQSPAIAGASLGVQINAGTNLADISFVVNNAAVSVDYFLITGDGGIQVGTGGGGSLGFGTINVQNTIALAGNPVYAGIPQNSQAGNYALVLADANKHIFHGGGAATYTIPANAAVAYPIGTAITFVNSAGSGALSIAITTDTLYLSPSGSTGTRTLAAVGVATALKIAATTWINSGTGLS